MTGEIYLVQSDRHHKIGKSSNFVKRFNSFKTSCPLAKCIFSVRVRDYHRREKELHKIFKDQCVGGEWFLLSISDIETIKEYLYPFITSELDKLSWKVG